MRFIQRRPGEDDEKHLGQWDSKLSDSDDEIGEEEKYDSKADGNLRLSRQPGGSGPIYINCETNRVLGRIFIVEAL